MTNKDVEILYPNIGRRIKAVLVDSVLFIIVLVSLIPFLAEIETDQVWLKIAILFSPFLILDPLLVSLTGGSIGHHVFKIRIRDTREDKNINIICALIRFVIKTLFGSLSLILIFFTKKHQALHDLSVKSIVVMKNPENLDNEIVFKERNFEEKGFIYPSKIRRLIVIIAYNFILFILLSIVGSIFISDPCLESENCNLIEEIGLGIIGFSWLIIALIIIYRGVNAQLIGCKKKNTARKSDLDQSEFEKIGLSDQTVIYNYKCKNCGMPYTLEDSDEKAEKIYCSSCKAELDKNNN